MKLIAFIMIAVVPLSAVAESPQKPKFTLPQTEPSLVQIPGICLIVIPAAITLRDHSPLRSLTEAKPPFADFASLELIPPGKTTRHEQHADSAPVAISQSESLLRNPFGTNSQDIHASLFADCLTLSKIWEDTGNKFFSRFDTEITDKSETSLLIPISLQKCCGLANSFFSRIDECKKPIFIFPNVSMADTFSLVDWLINSKQKIQLVNVYETNTPRTFPEIDAALRPWATKIGRWKNINSRFEWTLYEVGGETLFVAADSQTTEIHIFSESRIYAHPWPQEIKITFDMTSPGMAEPDLDVTKFNTNAHNFFDFWVTPASQSSESKNESPLQFYFDDEVPSGQVFGSRVFSR